MTTVPLNVRTILNRFGLRPDKSLGQNFLIDEDSLREIVSIARITGRDTVLEIGPGLGSLTRQLAAAAAKVVAVELDEKLIPPLEFTLSGVANVRIIAGDILGFQPAELVEGNPYIVVANIPYYITSAVFRHLLESTIKPNRIILTIQQEVAERICANPGQMSLLALSVQVYGEPRIAARIPARAFYPAPKVDSAVILVDLFPEPQISPARLDTFFRLTRAGFSQKRKTLRNSLSAGLAISPAEAANLLESSGIDPMRRAETLSIPEWGKLTEGYTAV